jgi:hypothetical protein
MGTNVTTEPTVVATAMGELRGIIRTPDARDRLPGLVFVDGSGCGGLEEWGDWPEWISDCGVAVLAHDTPGCGQAPGDWPAIPRRDQLAAGFLPMLTEFLRRSG